MDPKVIVDIVMTKLDFEEAIKDIDILLQLHDLVTGGTPGRPKQELAVLKRSGIILTVTAWETFVEDTLVSQFELKLEKAINTNDLQSAFNAVAQSWLQSQKLSPPSLAKWTGSGWKEIILEKFKQDVSALNTLSSANVKKLFKRYLDLDITQHWKWHKTLPQEACQELDKLIELRGKLVHRGKNTSKDNVTIRRGQVVRAKELVMHLVDCTETVLFVNS